MPRIRWYAASGRTSMPTAPEAPPTPDLQATVAWGVRVNRRSSVVAHSVMESAPRRQHDTRHHKHARTNQFEIGVNMVRASQERVEDGNLE